MKAISSLLNVEIREGRRVGNTERIVNKTIDLLFQGKSVLLEDHHQSKGAQRNLEKRVAIRIIEHLPKNQGVTKFRIDSKTILKMTTEKL